MSARDAIEALLAELVADPRSAARAVPAATGGAHGKEIVSALGSDARFGPPLCEAIRDAAVLRDVPWLVQFLGRMQYAPAAPELLAIWRAADARVAYQAGQSLAKLGDRAALEAMADDVATTRGTATGVALDALYATRPDEAFARLAPLVEQEHANAIAVLSHLAVHPDRFASDARWTRVAIEALRGGPESLRAAARELLGRVLSKTALEEALAEGAPTPAPRVHDEAARAEALESARGAIAGIVRALPPKGWSAATPKSARLLRAIEELVGPLPAYVRAFYEKVDGVDIGPERPARDRFVVHDLATVAREARAWARAHAPRTTPAEIVPPFHFPVAPDGYTKAGLSGGPPIGFTMPCDDEDPRLLHVRSAPRFSAFVKRATKKRATAKRSP